MTESINQQSVPRTAHPLLKIALTLILSCQYVYDTERKIERENDKNDKRKAKITFTISTV